MDQERTFEPLASDAPRRRTSSFNTDFDSQSRRTSSKTSPNQDATSQSDPDTCRICRGEGTVEEPLFYPCKCSGSIKYVHQDCLMEWLSHSQKKHCELCKTPFRFTKLYAPNMPKSVPSYIFVSHITKYLLRNILVWARGGLVLMVWLVWLPYLMRRVWSALFWLSDEGLGPVFGRPEASSTGASATLAFGPTTCPSSPLFAHTTTPASVQAMLGQLSQSSHSQTTTSLYGITITTDNPLPSILLNMFLGSFYIGGASRSNVSVALQSTATPAPTHQPSLLSEVAFLQKLSSTSPALGGFAIDVLEGQIITVLVIICFILIILVRDYVVQQQPDINMRAAFAAAENDNGVQQQQQNIAPNPVAQDAEQGGVQALPPLIPRDELRAEDIDLADSDPDDDRLSLQAVLDDAEAAIRDAGHQNFEGPEELRQLQAFTDATSRPDSPTENVFQSGRSRRGGPSGADGNGSSAVDEYIRIYRDAQGDPDRIIQIARQRNVEEKLAYYIQLTQSQASRNGLDLDMEDGEVSNRPGNQRQGSDWNKYDDSDEEKRDSSKGKSPMTNDFTETGAAEQNHTSRPRSATDGPQRVGGINPLGHNNWSFTDSSIESVRAETQSRAASGDLPSSTSGPAADTSGSTSQAWTYMTPPSSTLAESAPSSLHSRTPSSSENNGSSGPHTDAGPAVASDSANAQREEEWEAMPDHNGQVGHQQQNADARAEDGVVPERAQGAGLAQRVADFMWRDVEAIPPHELPPLPDGVEDFFDHELDAAIELADAPAEQPPPRDQEVIEAAAAAGIDAEAEAIEDAEDLEGILELLGMRGPIAGLFQNALFCAFLVSITLLLGVFIPYNTGRLSIWLVANPTRPVRILFSISKLVQDMALLLAGFASTVVFGLIEAIFSLLDTPMPQSEMIKNVVQGSWNMTESAADRLLDSVLTDLPFISTEEVRNFSIVSHAALLTLKSQLALLLAAVGKVVLFLLGGDYLTKASNAWSWAVATMGMVTHCLHDLPGLLSIPSSWVIDLGTSPTAVPVNTELAAWGAMDRVWAILGGYVAMCVTAALYLGRGSPISPGRVGQEWEATLIDALVQASGVMKVILIIGIEMLVFPLYCGLLLDVALLPLFEDTTVMSRVMFTVNYPLTSIFVHWFVGTGYMFHFALFVSMCRKIMRKGVLYFIRDPDDAEFHPVRDVLERNVTTQLRKILFSAFVYGALVIVCLGGVVWALSYGFRNVLPIYYSSNEPVLEFPIDLLFYNFLMPIAIRFFKPSDGLHTMYTWWFRKLARGLRLTWFLFGIRRVDEEGTLRLGHDSPAWKLPWWKRLFLEVDGRFVVPKTFKDTFEGGNTKPPSLPLSREELRVLDANKARLVESGQLIPDGRFVRAPASDQVKIPKGEQVFFEVSERNERLDGKSDRLLPDIWSTGQYQFVYVPPNFRLRIFLFILFIWLFAAATGLGFTIIPLIFGRWMFRLFIPNDIRTNDIYAFSIGLYILGSLFYFMLRLRHIYHGAKDWAKTTASSLLNRETLRRATAVTAHAAKLVYTYFFLLVVFPFMVSSLLELYILIPLDTYMYGSVVPNSSDSVNNSDAVALPRHTVRVMQSWTIGVIYLKLAARYVVHWHRDSRIASATRAVLRHGWLEPDVKVLTRAFVVPGLSIWTVAVFGPLVIAKAAIRYAAGAQADTPNNTAMIVVYRFCFCAALICAMALVVVRSIMGVFRSWRVRIKDEAYLIGERLHNFNSPPQALHEREADAARKRRGRVGWE